MRTFCSEVLPLIWPAWNIHKLLYPRCWTDCKPSHKFHRTSFICSKVAKWFNKDCLDLSVASCRFRWKLQSFMYCSLCLYMVYLSMLSTWCVLCYGFKCLAQFDIITICNGIDSCSGLGKCPLSLWLIVWLWFIVKHPWAQERHYINETYYYYFLDSNHSHILNIYNIIRTVINPLLLKLFWK